MPKKKVVCFEFGFLFICFVPCIVSGYFLVILLPEVF